MTVPSDSLNALTELVDTVRTSPKYRAVAPELIRLIGQQELAKRPNLKAAVKATKNKLHQITGAYWQGNANYAEWLDLLQRAAAEDESPDQKLLHTACRTLLAHHASTHERLPILREFYGTLFAGLPPIRSVLDLACGLNPLTIPWMGLAPETRYYACDVNGEQMAFLQGALPRLGVTGEAFVCDLLQTAPAQSVDVALLFKTIPCLEQVDKQIGVRLLNAIHAETIFVSFPAKSLGGRHKGMADTYSNHFADLLDQVGQPRWQVDIFPFATELVFRLRTMY
jgi:16S rRNA (guanine(1405)-N(7))-methyltransferase